MTNADHNSDVLFKTHQGPHGHIGHIILNRPSVLNALTHQMIKSIALQLGVWEKQEDIQAVLISGQGRGFCAGGDIRAVCDIAKTKIEKAVSFFWDEYRLNHMIHKYSKPYISLVHGVTMGGGMGLSMHGKAILGADDLMMAMPETGIGFFPDVGASYFLNQCPGKIGVFLGLTGKFLSVHDAYEIGWIKQGIHHSNFNDVIQYFTEQDFSKQDLNKIIAGIPEKCKLEPKKSLLVEKREIIDDAFQAPSVQLVGMTLSEVDDLWAQEILEDLGRKSPLSMSVTLEQLTRAQDMSIEQCLEMEFAMVQHFLKAHDLYEGVRAMLVDKTKTPLWEHESLDTIDKSMVHDYFIANKDLALHFEKVA